jgi:elongation factor Ts
MPEFSAKDVQDLRLSAGVGMMDAKNALVETQGDVDAAFELLRERGLAKAEKRAGREAAEGTIGYYIHIQNDRPVMGVLVELVCETDFVAKSDEFKDVANDLAMHVSWAAPRWVTRDEVDPVVLDKEREMITRQAQAEGKPDQVVPKIVEGRLEKYYQDHVLNEQTFVNSEKFDGTVGDYVAGLAAKMGENISVRRLARLAIGEGD